ncbi:MAG: glycosyltransferase family 4 protein [Chloroflexi bacterium]|nr:glycosyltransferase family 4 protein [Chloroflexota bacterium]
MNKMIERRQRKLKILIILLYYHPHSTGLTHYVRMLAEELARRGHEVTVAASCHSRELPLGETTLNGVRVVRLWAPIALSRGRIMPTYPWAINRLLREHDVVNIHIPLLETALVAFLASIAGINIIPTHHGDLILPKNPVNDIITKIMFAFYKFMAKRVPCIIGLSDDYADNSYYLLPFRDKVRIIYPPMIIPEPDAVSVNRLRELWRQDGGPLIGYAGRFVQEKRPDLLIRSLDVVNQEYPNARIVFAGEYDISYEGTWQRHQDLVERYRSQLRFLGLIRDKQDLANFYAACDVLVVPSDSDCFPLVQGEAMLCGTPIVMTDIAGGRVAVTLTGMGKLAKPGDWRSIGETTLEVLADPERYIKSREYIRGIFSFEETVSRYESILYEYAKP